MLAQHRASKHDFSVSHGLDLLKDRHFTEDEGRERCEGQQTSP